jgi:hypothetical protein
MQSVTARAGPLACLRNAFEATAMKTIRVNTWLALPAMCCCLASSADAADLTGIWATNVEQCGKIFVKRKLDVSFQKDSDIYGSGFIIEGSKIKAKAATCTVKSQKEDGSVTHLLTACATEITFVDTQMSFRLVDHDTLERLYPGVPELNSRYRRCEM